MGKSTRFFTVLFSVLVASITGDTYVLAQEPDAEGTVTAQLMPFIIVGQNPLEQKPQAGVTPAEPNKEPDAKPADKTNEPKPPVPWWERVPVVQPYPRPGLFLITPTGPGYYSLFDVIHDEYREKPPIYPYPRVSPIFPGFFNFSFAYLDKPDHTEFDYFDPIKRIHFADNWLFSTGGELRYRYNFEVNSRLTGVNNDFDLFRARLYGDWWYRDAFRVYIEFISAAIWNNDLPTILSDDDPADFLNFFIDVKLCETCDGPVYFRGGRQELLYGSQRLISPLDWSNTRRTFQGYKVFWRGEKDDLDAFAVQPVFQSADGLAGPDHTQWFSGVWYTRRPTDKQTIDAYVLNLDQSAPMALGRGLVPGGFNISTIGGRYVEQKNNWLWDVEGAVQFGKWSNQSNFARMGTAGIGYYFKDCCWTPEFWAYYDYASGDPEPGVGNVHRTFNQLFPFGHYYFSYSDLVGRQNINDFNVQLSCYPTKWITTLMQFHVFRLDTPKDALYAANGRPIRFDPTGRAGVNVGEELDFVVNFHISKHQDFFISYSHLFPGSFIAQTGDGSPGDFLYLQYSYRW